MSKIRGMAMGLALATLAGCGSTATNLPEEGVEPARGVASRSEPRSASQLVSAMHARYADSWYRTLSFKQRVIRTAPDGTRGPEEVWTEWAEVPGMLRIDLAATHDGNGVIYRNDSLYVFRDGRLAQSAAQRNELLVLGFDVYAQAPARTLAVLGEEGFDLSKMRQDTWQGRGAYVVGADAGDERSPQFWIDEERLLFVRLVQPLGQDSSRTMDIRFDDYEPLAGGWIAPLVVFLVDGVEVMREEYFEVEANPVIPPGTFDPERWGPVGAP